MERLRVHLFIIVNLVVLFLSFFIGCGSGGVSNQKPPAQNGSGGYIVGGTIKGLIGTGLILQNNGGDDLVIEKNGPFEFSSRIEEGILYSVTILSQPENPRQVCQVINGSQPMEVGSANDVLVECLHGFYDDFEDNINRENWNSSAEFSREIVDGALQYYLSANSDYDLDYLSFTDLSCSLVEMDLLISDTQLIGNGVANYTVRLESCGYHSTVENEKTGSKIGDVFAALVVKGSQSPFDVYYYVFRCLTDQCGNYENVEMLTPGENGTVRLGEVVLGEWASLMIDFDTMTPGQFSFQLNNGPISTFDPVVAGAPISSFVPNCTGKYLGLNINLSNPEDVATMTASFDNVRVDGELYDNFEATNYPDVSRWNKPYGTLYLDGGRLLMETAKQYSGDASMDNRFHSTDLISHNDMIPNGESVYADILLDSATQINNSGGTPAEVQAIVESSYVPPNSEETDFTNQSFIQTGLKQDPSGVIAEVHSFCCVDSSCITKYIDEYHIFNTPVTTDVFYRFDIEPATINGQFNVTLDGTETIALDLSMCPGINSKKFKGIKLRTMAKGTDRPEEESFIRAYFDNISVGSPL